MMRRVRVEGVCIYMYMEYIHPELRVGECHFHSEGCGSVNPLAANKAGCAYVLERSIPIFHPAGRLRSKPHTPRLS